MSDLTFQEVKQKNGRTHRWLIRHEAPHTNDGFYTIGKIERERRYNYRTKERWWSEWRCKINGDERLTLERFKQITEFWSKL